MPFVGISAIDGHAYHSTRPDNLEGHPARNRWWVAAREQRVLECAVVEDRHLPCPHRCGTIVQIDLDAVVRNWHCPEQADRRELAWVQIVDLCAARTGQVHIHSNERKRARMLLPIRSLERSRHEPHVGIGERELLSFAGPDVGPRHIATDKRDADGTLEVADAGRLRARAAKDMKRAHRTKYRVSEATRDRNRRERPRQLALPCRGYLPPFAPVLLSLPPRWRPRSHRVLQILAVAVRESCPLSCLHIAGCRDQLIA